MNIRRLVLDVDKALKRPSLLEIAEAISKCHGVEAFNLTVGDIDVETLGMDVTIEGSELNYDELSKGLKTPELSCIAWIRS